MNFNHQIIDELIKAITPIPCEFGVMVEDDCGGGEPINFYDITKKVSEIDPEAEVEYGLSKLVIIPSDSSVVIKIPFNGMDEYQYKEYDEENDDEDEDYDDGEWVWSNFYGASGSIPDDYCQAEYEKFLSLKDKNLECFVAETEFYSKVDSTNIFIAEKVIPFDNLYKNIPNPSKKSKETAEQWRKSRKLYCFNEDWLANCIDFYGQEKVEKFINYCYNDDNDIIRDLHGGNFGYRQKDNSPCILDYSDFNN